MQRSLLQELQHNILGAAASSALCSMQTTQHETELLTLVQGDLDSVQKFSIHHGSAWLQQLLTA
jgi:hypothetical protein